MSRLTNNSSDAERLVGCSFAERNRGRCEVISNNGTIHGDPEFDYQGAGVTLDGTSDYISYVLRGDEFDNDEISIVLEFWPDFEAGDGINHYFVDASASNRFIIYKDSADRLIMYLGHTSVGYIALSVYEQYWKTNERNVIVVAGKSGNNKLWLNGHLVISSATAWTAKQPTSFFIGATCVGTAPFKGKIGQVKVFQCLLEEQDALNYYNHTDSNDSILINLPMEAKHHDPDNLETKDVSGNGYNAALGDGLTPSTYPTKLGSLGYSYLSTNSLRVPIVKTLPSTAITMLIDPIALGLAGSYVYDLRRNGGSGYAYFNTNYTVAGYNITAYIDGKADTLCDRGTHAVTFNCVNYASTEGIDIGSRYNYNASTNFLGHMKSFLVHDRQLTPLEIAELHLNLLRRQNNV